MQIRFMAHKTHFSGACRKVGLLNKFLKVGMDQILPTNRKHDDKRDLFPKDQCKISIFTFVHSVHSG